MSMNVYAKKSVDVLKSIAREFRRMGMKYEERLIKDVYEIITDIIKAERRGEMPDRHLLNDLKDAHGSLSYAGDSPIRRMSLYVAELYYSYRDGDEPDYKKFYYEISKIYSDIYRMRKIGEVYDYVEDAWRKLERIRKRFGFAWKFTRVMTILEDFSYAIKENKKLDLSKYYERNYDDYYEKNSGIRDMRYELLSKSYDIEQKLVSVLNDAYYKTSDNTIEAAKKFLKSLPKIYQKLWGELDKYLD